MVNSWSQSNIKSNIKKTPPYFYDVFPFWKNENITLWVVVTAFQPCLRSGLECLQFQLGNHLIQLIENKTLQVSFPRKTFKYSVS